MKEPLLYYSTNTRLAFFIAEKFYQSIHFVWCSPVYSPEKLDQYDIRRRIPASSSPYKIYRNLLDDVRTTDKHSSKIVQNRIGLKKGAATMLGKGVIDTSDLARILAIIDSADVTDFTPLIYLIPANLVSGRIEIVDVAASANPMSIEYKISDLKRTEFEIIEFD